VSAFVDTEAAVAEVLRPVVGCPVYGRVPANPEFPYVKVQRITGTPVSTRPLYLDGAMLQVDVLADSQGQARSIADVARETIAAIENTHTSFGWLSGARLGGLTDTAEPEYTPTKARYRFDCIVWARVATPAARTSAN
jgi:hypothetical protein